MDDEFDPTALPRVVSRSDAHKLGYTDAAIKHRLAIGRWTRLLPRTYLTSDTLTWTDRLLAATTFAGPGTLLSGAAALCDRGIGSVRRPTQILVLAAAGRGPHSTRWVRIRRSSRPMRRELFPGPPRVAVARAVADWAVGRRHVDDVRALVADVVRTQLCTIDELRAEWAAGPRRGSRFFRQAIDEIDAGAWSAPEARAATLLRDAGVPPFEQNARIELPDGRWRYADFLWRELRAVLEIDSRAHHSLPAAADATSDRHVELTTLGYSVIHRTPRFLSEQPGRFVREVEAWLSARSAELAR